MEGQLSLESVSQYFSPLRIGLSLALILSTWWLLGLLRYVFEGAASRFTRYRLEVSRLYPVVRLLVWLAVLYIILAVIVEPPFDTLIAVTASAGLAIGLAAQDLVKNVLSGIVLIFDQPFQVGDMVQVDGHYGEVINIGLRSVQIRTLDDSTVTLPNSMVLSQSVSNSNSGVLEEMVVMEFCLPASVDVQEVKEMAQGAAASSPYVYLKKPITVLVTDHFDRTFLTRFKVKCYVLDVRFERILASDVIERIKEALIERGLMTESLVLSMPSPDRQPPSLGAGSGNLAGEAARQG